MQRSSKGFTLIELLIVVAIIAILAAIAVPNFLEAQVRSKVSRVKADQRSLATALESYRVDWNAYMTIAQTSLLMNQLSTPVAYITDARLEDPFGNSAFMSVGGKSIYFYANFSAEDPTAVLLMTASHPSNEELRNAFYSLGYLLLSAGPDRLHYVQYVDGNPNDPVAILDYVDMVQDIGLDPGIWAYDPTNGTLSTGDLLRTQKGIFEPSHLAN